MANRSQRHIKRLQKSYAQPLEEDQEQEHMEQKVQAKIPQTPKEPSRPQQNSRSKKLQSSHAEQNSESEKYSLPQEPHLEPYAHRENGKYPQEKVKLQQKSQSKKCQTRVPKNGQSKKAPLCHVEKKSERNKGQSSKEPLLVEQTAQSEQDQRVHHNSHPDKCQSPQRLSPEGQNSQMEKSQLSQKQYRGHQSRFSKKQSRAQKKLQDLSHAEQNLVSEKSRSVQKQPHIQENSQPELTQEFSQATQTNASENVKFLQEKLLSENNRLSHKFSQTEQSSLSENYEFSQKLLFAQEESQADEYFLQEPLFLQENACKEERVDQKDVSETGVAFRHWREYNAVDVPRMFTVNDLKTILKNCLNKDNITGQNYKVLTPLWIPRTLPGERLVLIINYEDEEGWKCHRFFLKTLNSSSYVVFVLLLDFKAYQKEQFLYEFLLKEFQGKSIDTSFATKSYFSKPYLFVMEDLTLQGYRDLQDAKNLSVDHCKLALKSLAKLHSAGILYENAKSDEYGIPFKLGEAYPALFKELIFTKNHNENAYDWLNYSVDGISEVAEHMRKKGFRTEDFVLKLSAFLNKFETFFDNLDHYKCTILHGDLWHNNLMFKSENNSLPTDCILVDYQFLKYGPPALDVLQLLFCNTTKAFRDAHFKDLVKYYYACLRECLPNLKINDILPRRDYLETCTDLRCFVKLQTLCERCISSQSQTFMQLWTNGGEEELIEEYLLDDRGEAIVQCYLHDAEFCDVMEEDITELYDLLRKQF